MKKKIRVGVLGAFRGKSMMEYCNKADNAQLVAICDYNERRLNAMREKYAGENITYYTSYDEMLEHDGIDAVVLANNCTQHVPFAIKAMEKGLHVISELLPCQTMKEAVELVETIERTGQIYCFAENYCYKESPWEMRKLYRQGRIGTLEYAEGDYIHERENQICTARGDKKNPVFNWYANFYCTHSIGPIVHITGLRPVKVTGFELPISGRHLRCGMKSGNAGIEMIEFENGALMRSYHGEASSFSVWYSIYGTKGRMESERFDLQTSDSMRIFVENYPEEGFYDQMEVDTYYPKDELSKDAKGFGFDGADYRMMWHMMEKMLGNPNADTIDVYEALDMFLPGMFAYRSVLQGGVPLEIPDLRDLAQREKWRNDTTCVDPEVAGDMLIPSYSKGEVFIDDSVYENMRQRWERGDDRQEAGLRDGSMRLFTKRREAWERHANDKVWED